MVFVQTIFEVKQAEISLSFMGAGKTYRVMFRNIEELRNGGPIIEPVIEQPQLQVNDSLADRLSTGIKNGGVRFSKAEERDLVNGYNKHRNSSFPWLQLIKDPEFCFFDSFRNNNSLSDKFKNLKKYKIIISDSDGEYSFVEG